MGRRHVVFVVLLAALGVVNAAFLQKLILFALSNPFSSHILLIPFISAALLFRDREQIFANAKLAPVPGAAVIALGTGLFVLSKIRAGTSHQDMLSVTVFALIVMVIGGFLLIYGKATFRTALFPVLFLLFAIPIPEAMLKGIVLSLQKGTAYFTGVLFNLAGTPNLRRGLTFDLPGVSVEIAPQCSGIRSSLSLIITCLLAGHLMLRSNVRKFILVLAAVPMAMFKNAVRVVGLSLLAIHVDMRFLTGSNLHHEGGILFFVMALVLLSPLLWILRRGERGKEPAIKGYQPE